VAQKQQQPVEHAVDAGHRQRHARHGAHRGARHVGVGVARVERQLLGHVVRVARPRRRHQALDLECLEIGGVLGAAKQVGREVGEGGGVALR
jgi:hypothetical protein